MPDDTLPILAPNTGGVYTVYRLDHNRELHLKSKDKDRVRNTVNALRFELSESVAATYSEPGSNVISLKIQRSSK